MNNNLLQSISQLSDFYSQLGMMIMAIEKSFKNLGFISLPKAGRAIAWGDYALSNAYDNSQRWLLKNLQRCYLPMNVSNNKKVIIISVSLFESPIHQASILCAVLEFDYKLTYDQIWSTDTWHSAAIRDINFGRSWIPDDKWIKNDIVFVLSPEVLCKNVRRLYGYLIELLEITNEESVKTNICAPLIQLFNEGHIGESHKPRHLLPYTVFTKSSE